ncbi:MAG: class I SAM-dependent methyltransferase [bacterium]
MDVFNWIEDNLRPRACTSVEIFYDCMESQSFECLPVIYKPFDAADRSHWCDRGSMFDFLHATRGAGRRLLDFGPGDGWPSLIVAPLAAEVVGVDASRRRVEVCAANAKRLGLTNTGFLHVPPGEPLPFDDDTFDGVMAASSVEQTPDPAATLREFFRILKPGGRLRVTYEDLDRYRDSSRHETWLWSPDAGSARLVVYDRHIEDECAVMYGMTFSGGPGDLGLPVDGSGVLPFDRLTAPLLESLKPRVTDAVVCRLSHPSGRTYSGLLNEIAFSEVIPSHSGAWFAGELFDRLSEDLRPLDMASIDDMLSPAVEVVVEMRAPLASNPRITAVK